MKHKLILLVCIMAASLTLNADWVINESFENGIIPSDWTVHDGSYGASWSVYENASYAHSGNWSVFSESYHPGNEETWLILPAASISQGDSLKLAIRSWYSTEDFEIKLSTGSTNISSFTITLDSITGQGNEYQVYCYDLSNYAGLTVHAGIHWMCDTYGLLVDDVKLGQPGSIQPQLNLPATLTFEQGSTRIEDFEPYITCADPSVAQLGVIQPDHVTVDIDQFSVTFGCLTWNGTEDIVFTLNDNQDRTVVCDTIAVTVTPADITDLAVQSVDSPQWISFLGTDITPAATIANLGGVTLNNQSISFTCTVEDANNQTVYSTTMDEAFTLAPQESMTLTFSDLWQPAETGEFTVTISHSLADDNPDNNAAVCTTSIREHIGTGGPDTFGYQWIDNSVTGGPEFNWIDISQTGTSSITYGVPSFAGDDNFSEPIDLGFEFPFYGFNYSSVHIDINGELLFADNSWYDPYPSNGWDNDGNVFNWMYPIPGYAQMPALISVYWDDLEADEGVGDIYFQSFGDAPNRYFVIQWANMRFHSGTGGSADLNFEVILHESGDIVMQYQGTSTGQTGTNAPHDYGQSATVAIQNEAADMGLCYLQEQVSGSTWVGVEPAGNILLDGKVIRFYTDTDTQPPVIAHTPVGNTFCQTPTLSATITDLSGVAAESLHYNDGSGWYSIVHTEFVAPNTYIYQLPQLPLGAEIFYYFSATDAASTPNSGTLPEDAPDETFTFTVLPTTNTSVLLAYAGYQDHDEIELNCYRAALQTAGVQYDSYNWQEWNEFSFPDQYKTIIVYANSSSATDITDTLSIALMDFMDSGTNTAPKNVFFSSDNFAYNQSGHPNASPMKKLLTAYFRTTYVATGIGGGSNGLAGPNTVQYEDGSILVLDASPAGVPGVEMDVYANSPDCIFQKDACPPWYEDEVQNPDIGSENAFVFEDGPINGQAYLYHGVCGTYIDNLIYKGFYFSFDISQLVNQADINTVITDILTWFGSGVSSDPQLTPAVASRLIGNFPNPFNPSTMIEYTIPQDAQKARIEIYDIKGRLISHLTLHPICETTSCVNWNGTDSEAQPVASGIYFYRLVVDGATIDTRKMMLLK
jgi:hypothetical protein